MKQILFALLFIPVMLFAQDDEHYLSGAVPVVDGKVCFSREIDAPTMSGNEIYQRLLTWGEKNYKSKTSRVAYKNEKKGEIGILVEESSESLSLDETTMRCQIIIEAKDHVCKILITNIKYDYNVPYQKDPEKYIAEEWITDEYGLSRDKSKLNRVSGKFRKATIDYAERVFDSAYEAIDDSEESDIFYGKRVRAKKSNKTTTGDRPTLIPEKKDKSEIAIQSAATLTSGYKAFDLANVPSSIIEMLPDSELNVKLTDGTMANEARWNGIGSLAGVDIVTITMNGNEASSGISDGKRFKLSFSKEGASNDEPWVIIECKKLGSTSNGKESVLIGEIRNIFIK